jgi:multiple sugar transport system permease protein
MLLPSVLVLVLLAVGPTAYLVYMAFHRQNLFQNTPAEWVGLDNFRFLFNDDLFRSSLWRTVMFAGVTLAIEMALGFLLALLVFSLADRRGVGLVRTFLTMPILVAPIVTALMWRFMYEPDFGVFNYLLKSIGVPTQYWLSDPSLAIWCVAAIDVWQWTPFIFLVILAGMYGLPKSIYEAAELDGTSTLRRTALITLPLIKRVVLIALLLRAIDLLRVFDIIIGTTQGGPGNATYTLPVDIWSQGFQQFAMGDAAASALVLLVGIAVLITVLVTVVARGGIVAGSTK